MTTMAKRWNIKMKMNEAEDWTVKVGKGCKWQFITEVNYEVFMYHFHFHHLTLYSTAAGEIPNEVQLKIYFSSRRPFYSYRIRESRRKNFDSINLVRIQCSELKWERQRRFANRPKYLGDISSLMWLISLIWNSERIVSNKILPTICIYLVW